MPMCIVCGTKAYSEYCFRHKPRKPIQSKKPITKRGKRTIEYEHWRDTVAKPYLIEHYGHRCSKCGRSKQTLDLYGIPLDVDHIKTRGSRADLKMVLSNVRFLCRNCHNERQSVV